MPIRGHAPATWIASQPSSRAVAVYGSDWRLLRTIDISSPLFLYEERSVRPTDADASMRWSAANSLVRMIAPASGGAFATIHSLTRLPEQYVFGQSVEFDYLMNVHDVDGRRLVSDVRLPGSPIGWDDGGVLVANYGPDGRHSAPARVTIARVPVSRDPRLR